MATVDDEEGHGTDEEHAVACRLAGCSSGRHAVTGRSAGRSTSRTSSRRRSSGCSTVRSVHSSCASSSSRAQSRTAGADGVEAEDWGTPRSSYGGGSSSAMHETVILPPTAFRGTSPSQSVADSVEELHVDADSNPAVMTPGALTPMSSARRCSTGSQAGSAAGYVPAPGSTSSADELIAPHSPSMGAWMTEPMSIHEPLLLLDEDEAEASGTAVMAQLREDLTEARASSKADRAALEDVSAAAETAQKERDGLQLECQRLAQENNALRLQLQNHHGIMAADWEQTLSFQERLRQEEAARASLANELAELREDLATKAQELASLRQDAAQWRVLCRAERGGSESLADVSEGDLDNILQVALPALSRLHAEIHIRSRAWKLQLAQELEHRLCVVCRDAEKAVLFKPCLHICVCEGCRGRLKPYRCPICQEPVREHEGRVHF